MGLVDFEGGGELAGAGQEVGFLCGLGSVLEHSLLAGEGFGGADEDRGGVAFWVGDEVEHPVVAVGEVDVGVTGRAEHGVVFGGLAAIGVASGIVGSGVSFDFDDLAGGVGSCEDGPEDAGSDDFDTG